MSNDFNKECTDLVEKLTLVKNEFLKNKQELNFSIRRDVVVVQLKEILKESKDIDSMKNAIQNYIVELLDIKGERNNGK